MELKYIIIIVSVVFLLLIVLGLAIVNYSSEELVDKFKKTQNYQVGTSPLEFAVAINKVYFNNSIKIKFKDNLLCDSFSSNGVLTLCSKYSNDYNLAGLSICAHELGHAFQFKEQPKRMKSLGTRVRLSKLVSWLISPLFIGGIIAMLFSEIYLGIGLIAGSLMCFIIAVVAKWSTLNIEKDASKRAMELLTTYAFLTDDEIKIAKKFLNSAKQTYVAELLRVVLAWTMLVKKPKN